MRDRWNGRMRVLAAALIAVAMTACAPTTRRPDVDPAVAAREAALQKKLALKRFGEGQQRVYTVASPILEAAVPLCGERVTPKLGILLSSLESYGKEYQQTAKELYGLGDAVSIWHVVPGGAAMSRSWLN